MQKYFNSCKKQNKLQEEGDKLKVESWISAKSLNLDFLREVIIQDENKF